ncbi:MAG: YbjN domain-containing protein [Chloroherpetonaceae bacterium]|nr:YbjN domain-containing protein [Chloroherpetonaceae bacterium]MDW8438759.1 YbjN domain-containing protein [Chloroherpetonaceae bacterium]
MTETTSDKFVQIKDILLEMDLKIVKEDERNEAFVVENEEDGIKNLVIDCAPPLLILEQLIMRLPSDKEKRNELYKRLLQMNQTLVHGAFAIDDEEKHLFFRDTLQIENLDANELQASINALSLAMAEHSAELLKYAKQ